MKFISFSICIALFMTVCLSACKNDFNDPSLGKAEQNDQQIRNYLNANQLINRVTPTTSGIYYLFTDTTATRNKRATHNEELEFTFTLSEISGNTTRLVDSSNRTKPAYAPFLSGLMVPGLQEGLLLMNEGQSARFFMPSNLAFGSGNDSLLIGEYVPVVFDVTLKYSRTQAEQIQDYATRKNLGTPTLKVPVSGDSIWVYRLTPGTGSKVAVNQTVTVDYTAKTLRASTPFKQFKAREISTAANSSAEVPGFVSGLTQLNVGDKALLIFASSLGYGQQGTNDQQNYIVPPYSPLVYEVTVKSAR